jgi:hypothetical protein
MTVNTTNESFTETPCWIRRNNGKKQMTVEYNFSVIIGATGKIKQDCFDREKLMTTV